MINEAIATLVRIARGQRASGRPLIPPIADPDEDFTVRLDELYPEIEAVCQRQFKPEYVRNQEDWRPALEPQEVFTRKPRGGWYIRFVKRERDINEFAVDGDNQELMLQLGRAYAHRKDWELVTPERQVNGNRHGYIIRHIHTGRILRVSVVRSANHNPVAEVHEWRDGAWRYHEITHVSRGRAFRDNQSGEYLIAWTKYHFLVKLLRRECVYVVTADRKASWDVIVDGYQRELWRVAGYDFREFPIPA